MKMAYITVKIPFGKGETFLIPEMLEIVRQSHELTVIPFRPDKEIYHDEARALEGMSVCTGLFTPVVLAGFCKRMLRRPILGSRIIIALLRQSRTFKIALKNLTAVPKAFYCAGLFESLSIQHIHAHWGSRTSTMAYIVTQLTGIPWSFTLHRWDIYENNLLHEKAKSAYFIRCISQEGMKGLLNIIGADCAAKVRVVHMGVDIPPEGSIINAKQRNNFICAVPANLLPVKGHHYLIEAVRRLVQRGITGIRCDFYGDGPLEAQLAAALIENGLSDYIVLRGRIGHDKLLDLYRHGEVDAVVLPSIGEGVDNHEGIPVSLMEAMAYGITVISTNTGGIPELIGDGDGIMVEEKNSCELAAALERVMTDEDLRNRLFLKEREKVGKDFSLATNVAEIIQLMKSER